MIFNSFRDWVHLYLDLTYFLAKSTQSCSRVPREMKDKCGSSRSTHCLLCHSISYTQTITIIVQPPLFINHFKSHSAPLFYCITSHMSLILRMFLFELPATYYSLRYHKYNMWWNKICKTNLRQFRSPNKMWKIWKTAS